MNERIAILVAGLSGLTGMRDVRGSGRAGQVLFRNDTSGANRVVLISEVW